jgi:hypothetical protein
MKKCWDHNPNERPTFSEINSEIEKIKKIYLEKEINNEIKIM